jgi:hypothetical protein
MAVIVVIIILSILGGWAYILNEDTDDGQW